MVKPKDLMLPWLENMSLEKVQRYAGTGRRFSSLSTDQVKSQWAEAFKSFASNPSATEATKESDDLEAELTLRNEALPMGLVQVEWQELQKRIDRAIKDMKSDPNRLKQANAEIVEDLVSFYEESDSKPKN